MVWLAGPVSAQSGNPLAGRALAPFAARRVLVLPTYYLRSGDSLGWSGKIANEKEYLDNLDAEIRFAVQNRGVKLWVFPKQLEAAARLNASYVSDPADFAVEWLRPPGKKLPDLLPEPLATQLRSLIAIEEDSRFVLLPVEVRFEPAGTGSERALLRLVVFDARLSRVVWMADVGSEATTTFGPAIATSLADHVADLIGAP